MSLSQKIVKITHEKFKEACESYFVWKELNERMKNSSSRGVNIHEGITEPIVCYVNDYKHSVGKGSEDAFTEDGLQVQVKASSNFHEDLTSFGPTSEFDILEFVRINQETDEFYLYRIPLDNFYDIKVNATETVRDKQLMKLRPRFSLIQKYIVEIGLEPYAIVNVETGEITRTI